jgi:acyl-CoA synthetase (AMP-forming)/AMP-acid ligase II
MGVTVGNADDGRWPVRQVPAALRERYVAAGWWSDETLGELVENRLGASPDAGVNLWSETRPWHGTYADIHADARRLVTFLSESELEPGDVVAFQMPNWREAVVAFYGLAMGGYVLVPIVHIYGHKEVRFILGQSGARAYISADRYGHVDYLDIVDGAAPDDLPDLKLHVVVGSSEGAPRPRPSGAFGPAIGRGRSSARRPGVRRVGWDDIDGAVPATAIGTADCDDVCVLAYTSGTTSDPKGVMHSHRTLLGELMHMRSMITAGMPNLMGSPVTHATGMLGAVLGPMEMGEDIHLIDKWDPARVLDVMLEADVGAGTGASVFLSSILDHPDFTPEHARHMRRVGLGGAPVPIALSERAAALGIQIVRAYGSTEHPSVTSSSYDDPAAKRHGTDGAALPGVEIRLLGEDGSPVPPGEPGEIWSRGPDLCLGYADPALTAEMFDGDGWYRSGDMGVRDADGFVTITDRVKDVIIRGGENISAAEVEDAIGMLPQVAEVAVVAAPDERMGEHACALVRLAGGTESLELADITAELERIGIARPKWPEELRIVDDFPRTATGKIRKVDLRRQLRTGTRSQHADQR